MTVLIHERIKVFATTDTAEAWFLLNDPEGVAFEFEVLGLPWQRLNFGDGGAS
jgi:hypothetical protein